MSLWKIFLACWFAMYAFLALTNVSFKLQVEIMGILAALIVVFLVVEYRAGK